MEGEMIHFSHNHPLVLKAEEPKIDGTNQSKENITCNGCSEPVTGPFYSCRECGYYLHKVCAELPNVMNHPMHPQHPLTLLSCSLYGEGKFLCSLCREVGSLFVYNCSICEFDVDMICASTSHTIEDKCHQHPLIPLQQPSSFLCHICQTEEKGLSYKCNYCRFWVHQNCTISLPNTVNHSDHDHFLTLLQSVPQKYENRSRKCDICHDQLSAFHCVYYCEQCMFFGHVNCARSEHAPQLPRSRVQSTESDQDLQPAGNCLALLPVQHKSTDLIQWFVENYSDRDVITNLILGLDECFTDRDKMLKEEIIFFGHGVPLSLIDDHQIREEKICDSCVLPISTPSYGCIDCGYFLHKYCTELPKQILHPVHPQHQISLNSREGIFWCDCCHQCINGLGYKCFQCENFRIDIKCASLLRHVIHEAHKHPLIPVFISSSTCSACGIKPLSNCLLQCNTCNFSLCFVCAMLPPMMKHRYDKHPFILFYSPPENHYNEYICELCEGDLNPKFWHYHCSLCDQFTHTYCMLRRAADSNIKYGKVYKFEGHQHELTLVSCTNDCSPCKKCRFPMMTGYSVGLKCIPCDFVIHLQCGLNIITGIPN